jgi:hypothetical protein
MGINPFIQFNTHIPQLPIWQKAATNYCRWCSKMMKLNCETITHYDINTDSDYTANMLYYECNCEHVVNRVFHSMEVYPEEQ